MPRVTLLIATKNSAERLPFLLRDIRKLFDEVVIGVDNSSKDATFTVANKLADKCIPIESKGYKASFFYRLFPHCTGDWILNIDDDEFMSNGWGRQVFSTLNPKVTQIYTIPRFQLTQLYPRPSHLPSGFTRQLRIFWNHRPYEPDFFIHSCGVKTHGPRIPLPDCYSLLHSYLITASREERRRKVEYYEKIHKGAGDPHIYLFDERANSSIKPLPPHLIPRSLWDYGLYITQKKRGG